MVKTLKRSACLFCSLGCGLAFRTQGAEVVALDYDKENPVNNGSLCPRGHYNIELINHPQRLVHPQIKQKPVSWDEALLEVKRGLTSGEAQIAVSCLMSNEDAYCAAKLAQSLGHKNIWAAGAAADLEAYQGLKYEVPGAKTATLEDIGNAECLLIIGDILTRSPVLSKRINRVKYGKRGNRIIVIDPDTTHTSWFATEHLRIRPGMEALALAGLLKVLLNDKEKLHLSLDTVAEKVGLPTEKLLQAANSFSAAASGCIIFAPGADKKRNDLIQYFTRVLSTTSVNKKSITFYSYGNCLGVNIILDQMIGDRPTPAHPAENSRLGNAAADYFTSDSTELVEVSADVLLPLASHLEDKGSFMLADGRIESLDPIAPRVGGKSFREICLALTDLKVGGENEVLDVINRGVPQKKVDLAELLNQARLIEPLAASPREEITHFGNNQLVKNFFWYRVNNG
jgi:predicted molibdopterin-dependent oxidoreductase YjgC